MLNINTNHTKPLSERSPEDAYALGEKDGRRRALWGAAGWMAACLLFVKFASNSEK